VLHQGHRVGLRTFEHVFGTRTSAVSPPSAIVHHEHGTRRSFLSLDDVLGDEPARTLFHDQSADFVHSDSQADCAAAPALSYSAESLSPGMSERQVARRRLLDEIDYEQVAEDVVDDSRWLSISGELADSPSVGGRNTAEPGRGPSPTRLLDFHKPNEGGAYGELSAETRLRLTEDAVKRVINEIYKGEGDESLGCDDTMIQLPLHIEVRAIGAHLLALRARTKKLDEELKEQSCRVVGLELQLQRASVSLSTDSQASEEMLNVTLKETAVWPERDHTAFSEMFAQAEMLRDRFEKAIEDLEAQRVTTQDLARSVLVHCVHTRACVHSSSTLYTPVHACRP
jgi:hypothetical protein